MARQSQLEERRAAAHLQHTNIAPESVKEVSAGLTVLPADVFALYIKTKNYQSPTTSPITSLPKICSASYGKTISP